MAKDIQLFWDETKLDPVKLLFFRMGNPPTAEDPDNKVTVTTVYLGGNDVDSVRGEIWVLYDNDSGTIIEDGTVNNTPVPTITFSNECFTDYTAVRLEIPNEDEWSHIYGMIPRDPKLARGNFEGVDIDCNKIDQHDSWTLYNNEGQIVAQFLPYNTDAAGNRSWYERVPDINIIPSGGNLSNRVAGINEAGVYSSIKKYIELGGLRLYISNTEPRDADIPDGSIGIGWGFSSDV